MTMKSHIAIQAHGLTAKGRERRDAARRQAALEHPCTPSCECLDDSFAGTELWQRRHPDHGPCDAMGPDGTCAGCTGIFLRNDGAWMNADGSFNKRAPLKVRLAAAFKAAVEAFNA